MTENRKNILIIFLSVFVVYFNSLFNPFIWDDIHLIVENPLIKNFRFFFHWFKSDLFGSEKIKFYRPMQTFVYSVIYHIGGLKPFPYHLINILLHSLNSILFYILLKEIFEKKIALFSAILFGVHPLNTEAITYISGTADPLWVFFTLLFILTFFKEKYLLSFLFLILSFLSKEIALIGPFYLLLFLWVKNKLNRKILKQLLYVFSISLIYIFLRFYISNVFIYGQEIPSSYRFFTSFKSFLYYIRLTIFPDRLSMERSFKWINYKNLWFISGFSFFIFSILISLYFRKRKNYVFPYLWFIINFIAVSNILISLNANFAEHFIYSGLVGLLIYYPLFFNKIFKKGFIYFITLLSILYGIRTISRNSDWYNPEKFYLKSIKISYKPVQIYHNLGFYYLTKGQKEKSLTFLKRAMQIAPEDVKVKLNIAGVFLRMKKYEEAENIYEEILNLSPDNPEILHDYAVLCIEEKNYKKGEKLLLSSIKTNRLYQKSYYLLAKLYFLKGEMENCKKYLKKSLNLNPDHAPSHNLAGILYEKNGKFEKAIKEFRKALEISPYEKSYILNLAFLCRKIGKIEEAIKYYKKSLSLFPDDIEILNDLGICYAIKGEKNKAIKLWKKALKINPNFKPALENIKRTE